MASRCSLSIGRSTRLRTAEKRFVSSAEEERDPQSQAIPLKKKELKSYGTIPVVFTLVTNVMIAKRGEAIEAIMLLELHYSEHTDRSYCSRNRVRFATYTPSLCACRVYRAG